MCLIVFAWRPGHPQPLVLAANRDEFHARHCLPLSAWEEFPGVYAGRDLQAGGTWMGTTANGRFAAVTNIRDPQQIKGARSRGELPLDFLRSELGAAEYLQHLLPHIGEYSGFNLLLGDTQALYFLNSAAGQIRRLEAGIYGVSNADLDTPWPKLQRAKAALAAVLDDPQPQQLFALLADPTPAADDELPDTGIGLSGERLLSSVFIHSPGYGTRASSVLLTDAQGRQQFIERSYDNHGQPCGEVSLSLGP